MKRWALPAFFIADKTIGDECFSLVDRSAFCEAEASPPIMADRQKYAGKDILIGYFFNSLSSQAWFLLSVLSENRLIVIKKNKDL